MCLQKGPLKGGEGSREEEEEEERAADAFFFFFPESAAATDPIADACPKHQLQRCQKKKKRKEKTRS